MSSLLSKDEYEEIKNRLKLSFRSLYFDNTDDVRKLLAYVDSLHAALDSLALVDYSTEDGDTIDWRNLLSEKGKKE